jgi:hypothetical protein
MQRIFAAQFRSIPVQYFDTISIILNSNKLSFPFVHPDCLDVQTLRFARNKNQSRHRFCLQFSAITVPPLRIAVLALRGSSGRQKRDAGEDDSERKGAEEECPSCGEIAYEHGCATAKRSQEVRGENDATVSEPQIGQAVRRFAASLFAD